MESTDLNLLMFLVSYLAHSLLIINFVLRLVQKGVLLFVFGVGSKVPMWRIVNTSIDLITLIVSNVQCNTS